MGRCSNRVFERREKPPAKTRCFTEILSIDEGGFSESCGDESLSRSEIPKKLADWRNEPRGKLLSIVHSTVLSGFGDMEAVVEIGAAARETEDAEMDAACFDMLVLRGGVPGAESTYPEMAVRMGAHWNIGGKSLACAIERGLVAVDSRSTP